MPNPKGNIASLRSFKSPWNNKQTRTIRVPVVLADQILEYARKIDTNSGFYESNVTVFDSSDKELVNALKDAIQSLDEMASLHTNSRFTNDRKLKLTQIVALLNSLIGYEPLTQTNEQPTPMIDAIAKLGELKS